METVTWVIQTLALLLACGTMGVAVWINRRFKAHLDNQEIVAHLKTIRTLTVVDWKPGLVLWVRLPSAGQRDVEICKRALSDVFRDAGLEPEKIPFLITPEDADIQAISVVDLMAVAGRAASLVEGADDPTRR